MPLKEMPSYLVTLNEAFFKDVGAVEMIEVLPYVAGIKPAGTGFGDTQNSLRGAALQGVGLRDGLPDTEQGPNVMPSDPVSFERVEVLIIRAAGSITDENTILILGNQAILGTVETPTDILARSIEADVFPLQAPEKMDVINGAIGEITPFQETFGYYAHGIPPDACALPRGWEKRLEPIKNENTRGVLGLCLSAQDLACAKLAAGRAKDIEFVGEMLTLR